MNNLINPKTERANLNGQRYRVAYEYDNAVATHITRITDSFNLDSSASHDYRFGILY